MSEGQKAKPKNYDYKILLYTIHMSFKNKNFGKI
jgi:hypothetical protein